MELTSFLKSRVIRSVILRISQNRTRDILGSVLPHVGVHEQILDLGAGLCILTHEFKKYGYTVVPLDIRDLCLFPEHNVVLYDGKTIPFADNVFGVVFLINVLHHTPDPELIVKEAIRVGRRLIIMEDVYLTPMQKILTFVMDSILNFEFFSNPHTNKSDQGWRSLFRRLSLTIEQAEIRPYWQFFLSATYVLRK